MKNILGIILLVFVLASCGAKHTINDQNETVSIESIDAAHQAQLDEKENLDKKKWSFMKDLMRASEQFYKKNNKYPKSISELEPYLYNESEFSIEEVADMFSYITMPNKLGEANECFEFSTTFQTSQYAKHHDELGKFTVGNTVRPICK